MIQKALLVGSITALTALLTVNLASHRPEAFFMIGWAASYVGNAELATRMFETWLESSKTETPVMDRLRIAAWAALTNSNFDKEAIPDLVPEANRAEWDERENLESIRLLALWNARAKDALTYEWTQRKMQLYGALVAYTGSYAINADKDAEANYEIVKNLLEEQVRQEKKDAEEKKEQDIDSGWDSKKTGEADEGWSKDGEQKKDEKPKESKSDKKSEGEWNSQPPKSWNWTNSGNPATLNSDPGWTRGSNGSVPLSPSERSELERNIDSLTELQKEREKFVRPEGTAQSQNVLPNSLRELFSWDPLFDSVMPQTQEGKNGKSW